MPFVYEFSPTDWFAAFQTPDDYVRRCREEAGRPSPDDTSFEDSAEHTAQAWLNSCRQLVKQHTGWEGDVVNEGVGGLPNPKETEPYLVYVLKQRNNGSTFAVSEIAIPGAAVHELKHQS